MLTINAPNPFRKSRLESLFAMFWVNFSSVDMANTSFSFIRWKFYFKIIR